MHELSRFAIRRIWFITYSGAFAVYFRPYRRAFDSLTAPAPGHLPSIRKKMQIAGGQPGEGAGRIWNWLMHKWAAVHGLRHSIARFAPALQLPLLSLQYTRYYIQDGIIGKTSSIDFWTKAQQPINLSPIFARHWHHISICFKPFRVNQQARCLESFLSTSPMILRASFNGLMVESYLSWLFCFAMVCRSNVCHSTVCTRPLPAKYCRSPRTEYHD